MATTLAIDVHEIVALAGRCEGAPPIIARELHTALVRSGILVTNAAKRNIQAAGAIDTGQLLGSIAAEVRGLSAVVGSNKTYAAVVEYGRPAGTPMPPPGSLDGWLQRHHIDHSADFAIRRAIGVRGIKARPYLQPALESSERAIRQEFADAQMRATKAILP